MAALAACNLIIWRYEMFWKWLWKVLAILLVLALFIGGGAAIYRSGYAHGVTAATWEAGEDGDTPSQQLIPHADPNFGLYARPRMFYPGFHLFLGFILLLFVFGGIGRLMHYSMWRSKEMPYPHHWGPGWHKYHHPRYRDETPSSGKPGEEDNPDEGVDSSS
jgi:hypothetical protein